MFTFYFGGKLSSVTPRSLRRLHWMLIPGPEVSFINLLSQGPGISQRAAARTQRLWRWLVVTSHKPQATSHKLDNRSGIV